MFSSLGKLKKVFIILGCGLCAFSIILMYRMVEWNFFSMFDEYEYNPNLLNGDAVILLFICCIISIIALFAGIIVSLQVIQGELEAKTTSLTNEIDRLHKELNALKEENTSAPFYQSQDSIPDRNKKDGD